MKYLLGIDVGTTGTKTILFSEEGEVISRAYRAYPTHTPAPGQCEQDPEDWWRAVCVTVREVCAAGSGIRAAGGISEEESTAFTAAGGNVGRKVAAISLSVQGGTLVPLDADGEPVRRAIVWNDGRCAAQREAYAAFSSDPDTLYQKTGWKPMDGLNLFQIRWMKENEPALFAKTAYFLSVPDYISWKMTGVAAVDLSNTGINQLADIRAGKYDPDLLAFAGISEGQLAKISPSGTLIGNLTKEAAAELGLTEDCVLVSGAHDQYAVALGAGAVRSGDMLIGTGTAWVVTAISDAPDFTSRLAQSVSAVPGKWGALDSLSSGGVCLDWWRGNACAAPDGTPLSYELLGKEAAGRKAAENGLFFFPFSGRAGNGKTFRRASFTGLDLAHDRFDISRAVMEGIVFQILWMMEAFREKPSPEGLRVAGGAVRSALWMQILADAAGIPVRIPEVEDLACVGAAVLAGAGCGIFPSVEEGYRRFAVRERVIYPDPAMTEVYAAAQTEYRRIAGILGEI